MNSDKILVPSKPVNEINAEIQIVAVAQVSVGKKISAPDDGDALFTVCQGAAQGGGDGYGTGDVIYFVESDCGVQLSGFYPSALCCLHQRNAMPFPALIDGYLTGKREHRDIVKIARNWMLSVICAQRNGDWQLYLPGLRINHNTGCERQLQLLGQRLQSM